MPTRNEVEAKVVEIFRRVAKDVLGRDLGEVRLETGIEQLGIGSMGLLEVVGELERELDIRFDDEQLGAARTVGELGALAHKLAS